LNPLTYLYKNQKYQLAACLEVIPEIMNRQPSPDTFSLPVSDQKFFFRIPFAKLDYLLYAWEHDIPLHDVADVLNISEDAVARAFEDFSSKNRATAHLREVPNTLE
jgi:NAD+ synthase